MTARNTNPRLTKDMAPADPAPDAGADARRDTQPSAVPGPIDAEAEEITAYLAGTLPPEHARSVGERLATDPDFQRRAEPIIAAWRRPVGLARISGEGQARRSGPRARRDSGRTQREAARAQSTPLRLVVPQITPAAAHVAIPAAGTPGAQRPWWRADLHMPVAWRAVVYASLGASVLWLAPLVLRVAKDNREADAQPSLAAAGMTTEPVTAARRSTTLDDGTRMTLGPNARLDRPRELATAAERRVALEGEALFDVARGDRPFHVQTPRAEVTTYGALVAVETGGWRTRVLVHSGTVEVRALGDSTAVRLQPGDELVVRRWSAPDIRRSAGATTTR